ncbi:UNVERIFIED_CONTAM: hypothetical protein HDU68_011974 [Siphonaria sp. JEL0065]|nr:hypothetical protein HDU68_011974 [Siphonaria sp. JEL0065]
MHPKPSPEYYGLATGSTITIQLLPTNSNQLLNILSLPKRQTYTITNFLGEGTRGIAFVATVNNGTRSVGLKLIPLNRHLDNNKAYVTHEAQVLSNLGELEGPVGIWKGSLKVSTTTYRESLVIPTRLHSETTLWDCLLDFDSKFGVQLLYDGARAALHRLHEERLHYTHGDPHAGNFTVDDQGNVSLIDFGHAKEPDAVVPIPELNTHAKRVERDLAFLKDTVLVAAENVLEALGPERFDYAGIGEVGREKLKARMEEIVKVVK